MVTLDSSDDEEVASVVKQANKQKSKTGLDGGQVKAGVRDSDNQTIDKRLVVVGGR